MGTDKENTPTLIGRTILDELSSRAAVSPRRRMNLDMRNSPDDRSQRMLNALEPGTVLPVHRHQSTSETVIVLRGSVEQRFHDDRGEITGRFVLRPGGDNVGINVPAGQWHSTVALEPRTVIFEAKDGPYAPLGPEDILPSGSR